MTRVEKLVIEGYRGIDYFEYEPKMINILVGRNNTGKSSILEAAALLSTASAGFYDALGNNILKEIIRRKGWENLKYFFNLNLEEKKLRLFGIIDGVEKEVNITYSEGYVPEILRQEASFLEYTDRLLSSLSKTGEKALEALGKPMLTCKILPGDNYVVALSQLREILPRVKSSSNVIFIGHQFGEGVDIKVIHDSLLPTARLHQTLDYLKNRIPLFNDVRSDGRDIWIYFENLPQPLPISMIGDGMRETIRLLFIASLIRGGILLMEEPENNLHPGLYDLVAERLVEVARQDGTQIFLSTHNLEFAERLLRNGGDLVNVIRLYRVKDELTYEVLEHGEALEELDELHIDLRGP